MCSKLATIFYHGFCVHYFHCKSYIQYYFIINRILLWFQQNKYCKKKFFNLDSQLTARYTNVVLKGIKYGILRR